MLFAGAVVFGSDLAAEVGCALRAFAGFCACTPIVNSQSAIDATRASVNTQIVRRDGLKFMAQTPQGNGLRAGEEYCKTPKEQRAKRKEQEAKCERLK